MSAPTVSVVIPCYNDGGFLQEAVESVLASTFPPTEIIIVNDGSTQPDTLAQLDKLADSGFTVIHQANKGQCSARNNGISKAKGSYIVSLDADNKVRSRYIETAIDILEKSKEIGVVYGKFDCFGLSNKKNIGQPFDRNLLLFRNYIDTLAVFRKSVWQVVGGYDTQLKGNEDWDFWLTAHEHGVGFKFIDEVMFDYRVKEASVTSMIKERDNNEQFFAYFLMKHREAYHKGFVELYGELMFARSNPVMFLLRYRLPRLYARLKLLRATMLKL